MQFIRHRINTIAELETINPIHGCEIDLRSDVSCPSKIHLAHDAWTHGENFRDWLDIFKQRNISGTLILNTKEDGLEDEAIKQCQSRGISNYFFLDTALPTFIKYMNTPLSRHFAVRFSSFETKDFIMQFQGKIQWVWTDCFNGIPMSTEEIKPLTKDYKICLVSPELQKCPLEDIAKFKHLLPQIHSICTKRPDLWL